MEKIIYQLTEEDIQNVAEQELGRELNQEDIKKIVDLIAENIPWYDAIADAIIEIIHDELEWLEQK